MTRVPESPSYWRSESHDAAMQDAHGFIWLAMLDTIDIDLAAKKVLDAGCNRGGFLRLLCDECAIAQGCGYDVAAGAIDDARRLAQRRPLSFEVAATVPPAWEHFDVAFSHEVLYLLHDLAEHAQAVFEALVPGGSYFAVMGVHSGSPLMVDWHRAHSEELGLPKLYSINEVAGVFGAAGFDVGAARLKIGFVPAVGHLSADSATSSSDAPNLLGSLDYHYDQKLLMRFTRPPLSRSVQAPEHPLGDGDAPANV
jgi:SAM-dependent methyltransferase